MKEIIKNYKYNIRTIIKNTTGEYNEDLEQEVWLKAWKNQDKYTEQSKLKQWINAITFNTCRDYLKSASFRNQAITEGDDEQLNMASGGSKFCPESIFAQKLRQQTIRKAIDELNPKLKEIIILFEFQNMDYEEIAKKLKCPVGTVKSRLYNARKQLSISLKELI